ncbi:MAG: hypothetical protein AAGI07_08885, partial [Bacteroidota bacterium]
MKLFYGSNNNPFLAPRGVYFTGKYLIVSDTGQNRLFIWNGTPAETQQSPHIVLGHVDENATNRNDGKEAGAATMQYPSGVWSNDKCLVVADAWNHRVLIWNTFPTESGQPADVVLGQLDFSKNQPNVKGVGTSPNEKTLYWPYGVFSDGQSLWVADTGNRRVLYFENIPQKSFTPADSVIGQTDFQSRDYNAENAIWPYSVKVNAEGKLAITDTSYYRVLLWNNFKEAFHNKAAVIIGQKNFEGNGQNQHSFFPKSNTLNWCYDAVFHKRGILVADTGNSRILGWEQVPK